MSLALLVAGRLHRPVLTYLTVAEGVGRGRHGWRGRECAVVLTHVPVVIEYLSKATMVVLSLLLSTSPSPPHSPANNYVQVLIACCSLALAGVPAAPAAPRLNLPRSIKAAPSASVTLSPPP